MAVTFEEARNLILENVAPLAAERVQLLAAVGRILAEELRAPWDLPGWDNSAMDGYAVRAEDCCKPVTLAVVDYLPAGGSAEGMVVRPGTAVKIMTGAPVPQGCTAVVPFEAATEEGDRVHIRDRVEPRSHIRFRGEDLRSGDLVIPAGTLLRPPEINMLAAFGQAEVAVYRRPRVAILSTGDELVELGEPIAPGKIVNSNSHSLAAAVMEAGGEPVLLGIARDNRESHLEKLSAGLAADVLITSAGVSAGDRDLVREVLSALGVRQIFWKAAIQPGGPIAFGIRGKVPVFSLPGNPVATLITFEMFVRPALLQMQGHAEPIRPTVRARLQEPAKKKPGRVRFMRVQVRGGETGLVVSSSGDQNTGILRTMVRANGIVILPAEQEYFAAGDEVDVHLLDPIWTLPQGRG
jgi:molybdopterin molybdotransferase